MRKKARWEEKWRERLLEGYAEPSRFLVSEIERLPAGRALDLASGAGRNALWLAERGWRVTGVDYSEVAVAEASRRASERGLAVDWILADVVEWVPERGAYDLVCVLYLQLPAHERRQVLARAAGALAPGGMALVVGHHLRNLVEGYGGPSTVDVLFTPDDVAAELVGLNVERAETLTRTIEADDGEHEAFDALVRARAPDA
jgi:SAM-dependent methyltransferase